MRQTPALKLLVATIMLIGGCRGASVTSPPLGANALPAGTLTGDARAAIDRVIRDAMQHAPAASLIVEAQRGGRTIYRQASGLQNRDPQTPASPQSVYPIGSLSKSFTGYAIFQLWDRGLIGDLNDPVETYLPGLRYAEGVTVAQLLNHTSGIQNYNTTSLTRAFIETDHTHAEMLSLIKSRPVLFAPGTEFLYSNSNYYLLGLIIEEVMSQANTPMSYEQYLRTHVFAPFGLRDTTTYAAKAVKPFAAHGYMAPEGVLVDAFAYSPTLAFSAGELVSSVSDLNRWVRGVHARALPVTTKISPAAYQEMMATVRLAQGTPIETQLQYLRGGWLRNESEGHEKIAHSGQIWGFESQLAYYPAEDLSIAVLGNTMGVYPDPVGIERKIARVLLGGANAAPQDLPLADADSRAFQGAFDTLPIRAFELELFSLVPDASRPGRLALRFGRGAEAPAWPLLYQGDGRFVTAVDDEFSIEFDASAATPCPTQVRFTWMDSTFTGNRAPPCR